jgi:peptidoglycan/LPS O-acetylase OafA/YrhL
VYLPPSEYRDFSDSLIAVSAFASNVLFWRESGYFDTASELKPLLHTWSLAVEEQYYLLFPLFLMLCWRLGRRWILTALGLVGAGSLAVAQWGAHANPTAAFFLLPTRGWELLLGAFTAYGMSGARRREFGRTVGELGGWLGVALIGYAVFAFDAATPFPGVPALVPTLGAVLVIVFATQQTAVGRFMGSAGFVGIGLVSYSAYLWHQPVFAFARKAGVAERDHAMLGGLSLLAVALAYVSWRYVETPFRVRGAVGRTQVFVLALVGSLGFAAMGYVGHAQDGFAVGASSARMPTARRSDRDFIVLGDSHGEHLVPGLASITTGTVRNLTSGGCIPFRNVDRYDARFRPGECVGKINAWLDRIIREDPSAIIVLSSMGPIYLEGTPFRGKDFARVTGLGVELVTDRTITDRYAVFGIGLRQTLRELSQLRNASVVLALDVPELGIDYGCARPRKEFRFGGVAIRDRVPPPEPRTCFVPKAEYDQRVASYRRVVAGVLSDFPDVLVFDPATVFCGLRVCKGHDPVFGFLYRDVDHLSDAGSRLFAEALVTRLSRQ